MNRSLTVTVLGKLDPVLSPNARVHWRTLADAKADAKAIAALCTRQELAWGTVDTTGVERAVYDIEIGLAKGEKTKDEDNAGSSCKYQLDAIATELGVDDRHWKRGTVTQVRDPDQIGYVSITLKWEQAELEEAS